MTFTLSAPVAAAEGAEYEFTITPTAALAADTMIRWQIVPKGALPVTSSDFPSLTGMLSFTSGATTAQTVTFTPTDDARREISKDFELRIYDTADDTTPLDTQVVTLRDNDDATGAYGNEFLTGNGDANIIGFGTAHGVTANGSAGDDFYVISRFQYGNVEITDTVGTNLVKFDAGVTITDYDEESADGFVKVISRVDLTLSTGAVVTIINPVGKFVFQLGSDPIITTYDEFKGEIRAEGSNETSTLRNNEAFQVLTATTDPDISGNSLSAQFSPSFGSANVDVFSSASTFGFSQNGSAGDDFYVISRFQYGNVEITDTVGTNLIKFDVGVTITDYDEESADGFVKVISRVDLTLSTGAVITIINPVGKFVFQLGDDDVIATYAEFKGEIRAEGSNETSALAQNYTTPTDAVFDALPTDLTVLSRLDGSATPIIIGSPVTASDLNGDTITYSLSADTSLDEDATGFAIDENGQITYVGTGLTYVDDTSAVTFRVIAISKGADGRPTEVERVVTITIGENTANDAVFGAAPTGFTLIEQQDGRTTPIIIGTVTATDADGDTVTYSLDGNPSDFAIGERSGQITYIGEGLNRNDATEASVTVIATSTGVNGRPTEVRQDVRIQIDAAAPAAGNDAVFTDVPTGFTLLEQQDGSATAIIIGTVTATDADGDTVMYSLDSAPSGFVIGETSGVISYTGTGLRFVDGASTVMFNVIATSTGADNTPTGVRQSVSIAITQVPDTAPDITQADSFNVDSAENTLEAVTTLTATSARERPLTWDLVDGHGDNHLFAITDAGEITWARVPDAETDESAAMSNVFSLRAIVTDDNSASSTIDFTVTLTDVNEFAPMLNTPPNILGFTASGEDTISLFVRDSLDNTLTPVSALMATDADAAPSFTWTLTGRDHELFQVSDSGVITWIDVPDVDTQMSEANTQGFQFIVRVSDGVSRAESNILVEFSSEAPTIATADLSITRSLFVNEDGSTRTDGVTIELDSMNRDTGGRELDLSGLSTFRVSSDENTLAQSNAQIVTFTAEDDETALNDITWTLGGDDAGSFNTVGSAGNAIVWASSPNFESPGSFDGDNIYSLTFTATDEHGGTDSFNFEVVVTDVANEKPIIEPITDSIAGRGNVNANGVDATDGVFHHTVAISVPSDGSGVVVNEGAVAYLPDGRTVDIQSGAHTFTRAANHYIWIEDPDDDGVWTLNNAANLNGLVDGEFFVLGRFGADADVFPSIGLPTSVIEVAENQDAVATIIAHDDDTDGLFWALTGSQSNLFNIDGGVVTWRETPDYEDSGYTSDADRLFTVTVVVADALGDSNREDTITLTIVLTDENEAPIITQGDEALAVDSAENQDAVIELGATDDDIDDAGNADTLSWVFENPDMGDANFFNIDSSTGVITWKAAPNFEDTALVSSDGDKVFNVRAIVTDGDATADPDVLTDSIDLAITLTDVNEGAPVISNTRTITDFTGWRDAGHSNHAKFHHTAAITDIGGGRVSINEGAVAYLPDGSIVDIRGPYSLMNTNSFGEASIWLEQAADETWQLGSGHAVPSPDTATIYWFGIFYPDDGEVDYTGREITDRSSAEDRTITIGGEIDTLAVDSAENQDAVASLSATDVDTEGTLSWTLSGADAALFTVSDSGVVTWANTPDYEAIYSTAGTKEFSVTATVTDDSPNEQLSDSADITVTLTNVDEAPVIAQGDSLTIEVSDAQQAVTTLTATDDATAADSLTWTLGGADADSFELTNGVVTWKNVPDFSSLTSVDSTNDKVFRITVTVSDGSESSAIDLVITLVDGPNPVIAQGATLAVESAENQQAVTTLTATDDSSTSIAWSLEETGDHNLFAIDAASGVITWVNAPDFESTVSSSSSNNKEFTITATASDGTNTDSTTLTITLTDEDVNAGAFVIDATSSQTIGVNAAGTSAASLVALDFTSGSATVVGTYGDFTLALSGNTLSWTYTVDETRAATQALAADAIGQEELRFQPVVDSVAGDTQTVEVDVVGVNDAPTIATTDITVQVTPGESFTLHSLAALMGYADVDGTLEDTASGQDLFSYAILDITGLDANAAGQFVSSADGSDTTLTSATTSSEYLSLDPANIEFRSVAEASDGFTFTLTVGDDVDGQTQQSDPITVTVEFVSDSIIDGSAYTLLREGDGSLADTLDAGSATSSQFIDGGVLADTITGSAHGDVIAGGSGDDTITLGAGADTVIYRFDSSHADGWQALDGGDVIKNFERGVDKLLFDDASDGLLSLADFLAAATPTDGTDTSSLESVRIVTHNQLRFAYSILIEFRAAADDNGPETSGGTATGRILRIDFAEPLALLDSSLDQLSSIANFAGPVDFVTGQFAGTNISANAVTPRITISSFDGLVAPPVLNQPVTHVSTYDLLDFSKLPQLLGTEGTFDAITTAVDGFHALELADSRPLGVTLAEDETGGGASGTTELPMTLKVGDGSAADNLDFRDADMSLFIQGGALADTIVGTAHGDFIAGGYGDDSITLGTAGRNDNVFYRWESGSTSTATDGGDTVTNFVRGEDTLIFVDVDTTSPIADIDDFVTYAKGADGVAGNADDLVTFAFGEDSADALTSIEITFANPGTTDGSTASATPDASSKLTITFETAIDVAEQERIFGDDADLSAILVEEGGKLALQSNYEAIGELLGDTDAFGSVTFGHDTVAFGFEIL